MGRGHQINIFRPLDDEFFENLPQFGRSFGHTYSTAGNGGILAVFAPQCTAAEKHRAAFAIRGKSRLFPSVEHGFGHQSGGTAAAEEPAPAASNPAAIPAPLPVRPAPGTAGELKLYNVEERDAAMVMAIVADKLGKPLNELRFISIREVTEQ